MSSAQSEDTITSQVTSYMYAHLYPLIAVAILLIIIVIMWYNTREHYSKKDKKDKDGSPSSEMKELIDEIHQKQKENKRGK